MSKFLRASILFFMLAATAWAQERTVSGRVTSLEDGSVLPGVNVVLKGTTTGTVTDVDGNFRLSIPANGGALVFSFIGLQTQEVVVGERTTVDVQLSLDVTQLGEVVVTAVGIQREKKALGYSVENVSGSKIQAISEPDPLRGLQGKVAGVNITGSSGIGGSATRITVRGNTSFLGNNQPLFVVDGIPFNNNVTGTGSNNQIVGGGAYGGGVNGIDPNNIASINVLKGGAAAALYGSRAANGVIVITTKSGGSRASRKGLEITYQSNFSLEQVANLPEYQNIYGTGTGFQYGQVNGSWGAAFNNAAGYPSITTQPLWTDIAEAFPDAPATVPYQAYPNNVKDFFQTGKVFENSFTFSGGNDKANVSATISHLEQPGFVPSANFSRSNFSIGGNTVLENKLMVGVNFAYNTTLQEGPPGGISNNNIFARTLYLGRNWDLQGQPIENPVTRESLFFIARTGAANPYWVAKYDGFAIKNNRVLANLTLSYDLTDWLNITYKGGINTFAERKEEWARPGSNVNSGLGQFQEDNQLFTELESNLILTANKDLSETLNLRALVGQNFNQRTDEIQSVFGSGFVDFNILDLDNSQSLAPNGGQYSRRRLFGAYADVTLGYKDFAFVTLTGRNDWSSTLPEANRSFFYPAVSASVIFTDALNMSSKVLTFGKLRASASKVGNDAGPYLLNQTYTINPLLESQGVSFPLNGTSGLTFGDIAVDPNLTPEFTTEYEIGTELQFFNNRASIDVALYDKRTTNQIAFQSFAATSGFQQYLTNFGEMSNRGIEISAMVKPIELANSFTWQVNGTFTHNKNVVEELAPGTDEIVILPLFAGSLAPVLRPGAQYGVFKGTVNARDEDGNLLIDPTNGQLLRSRQQEIIGNPNPDFILGLTNSVSFKGITLGAVVEYRKGGDLFSQTVLSMLGRGVTRDTENREINYIIPGVIGNPNTLEPVYDETGNKIPNDIQIEMNDLYFGETFGVLGADEWNVYDATWIKLREISLIYDLPKSILSRTPFGAVSIGLVGRNLWYNAPNFPKYTNFDPESNTLGSSNAQGFEYWNSPTAKRYGVTLRITF
jgi:TonB-linked SusC/RagA family outer membrane protein